MSRYTVSAFACSSTTIVINRFSAAKSDLDPTFVSISAGGYNRAAWAQRLRRQATA
jgi:hypothetical protein